MKRMGIIIGILFMVLLSGCGLFIHVSFADNHYTYQINNACDSGFVIHSEVVDPILSHYIGDEVPTEKHITAGGATVWISEFDFRRDLFADENFTFSFHFSNGVEHTFVGDLIRNDFRDANSWQVDITEDENGTPYYTYTYTFTTEDYEEIMSLYE